MVIVPGCNSTVQAQHAVRELADSMESSAKLVWYSSSSWSNAWPYERAVSRGRSAL